MLIYLLSAVVCVAFGAYGMLFIIGLCMTASSAERTAALPINDIDSIAHNARSCPLCEGTVYAAQTASWRSPFESTNSSIRSVPDYSVRSGHFKDKLAGGR